MKKVTLADLAGVSRKQNLVGGGNPQVLNANPAMTPQMQYNTLTGGVDLTGVKIDQFVFTVSNSGSAEKSFYLNPGLDIDADKIGLVKDGDFNAIGEALGSAQTLNGKGYPGKIRELHEYIRNNRMWSVQTKIVSDKAVQFSGAISVKKTNPFLESTGSRPVLLSDPQNENTFQDKIVTINKPLLFDYENAVKINIAGNSTMSITLNLVRVTAK